MTPEALPVVAVGAVVVDHDRLLLVQRGKAPAEGLWSVPGGRVEHGETLMEATVRELHEETGLEGVCGRLIDWGEYFEGEHHSIVFDFEVTLVGDDQAVAGDDAVDARWVDLPDVGEMALVDGLAELLYDAGIIPTFT